MRVRIVRRKVDQERVGVSDGDVSARPNVHNRPVVAEDLDGYDCRVRLSGADVYRSAAARVAV